MIGKAILRKTESSVHTLLSLVNSEDTAWAEVLFPTGNGYHAVGCTWWILLLDRLLGTLALLSSIPGSVPLDWNKTPGCILGGWRKSFLIEDGQEWCPRCHTVDTLPSGEGSELSRSSCRCRRYHLLILRGAEDGCMSQRAWLMIHRVWGRKYLIFVLSFPKFYVRATSVMFTVC